MPHSATLDGCGTLDSLLPNTLRFVRSGQFEPMAQVIRTELLDSGRLRQGIGGLLRLAKHAPPPPDLFGPIERLEGFDSVDPLLTVATHALAYVAGRPPAGGSHYEVTTVLGKTLAECQQDGALLLLERLMSTRLPAGCDGSHDGCTLAIRALVVPLKNLLGSPSVRHAISLLRVEVSDIPEDSFVSFMRVVTTVLTADVLDFAALHRAMQPLYMYLPAELSVDLDALLTALAQLTADEVGVKDVLISTLSCYQAQDPHGAMYRMFYTLISHPDFQTAELLASLDATLDLDPEGTLTGWLAQATAVLRKDPLAQVALLDMATVILEERNMSRILPTLLEMGDQGMVDDLRGLMNRDTCH